MTARVVYLDDSVAIFSPYSREFLAELRSRVPADNRRWARKLPKHWTVTPPYVELAVELVHQFWPDVEIGWPDGQPPSLSTPRPTWADEMFAGTPPRLHKAVYLALAKVLHPDAGGDARAAQQLNDARQRKE